MKNLILLGFILSVYLKNASYDLHVLKIANIFPINLKQQIIA